MSLLDSGLAVKGNCNLLLVSALSKAKHNLDLHSTEQSVEYRSRLKTNMALAIRVQRLK